jgi:basic membrane lipoprotein Med (substrate-binding protein (PBP1-ABC) superfamily)
MRRRVLVTDKRWTWLAVALATGLLVFGAASCGGKSKSSKGGGTKVGLVSDTGGLDDKGFNQFSVAGFKRGVKDFGLSDRVYVSHTADDYLPNLTAAAQDGNKFVIAVGFPRSSRPRTSTRTSSSRGSTSSTAARAARRPARARVRTSSA